MRPILFVLLLSMFSTQAQELVIGEERVEPGIVFIFEGAIKDMIMPSSMHLAEDETHIHIEARVNWDTKDLPEGTPAGGFIPYLTKTAKVTNEKTGLSTFIDLLPHINLIDNFHYARNISLPGEVTDPYTVVFSFSPPTHKDLALHKDWVDTYGDKLAEGAEFTYKSVDFEEIAKASRR